MSLWDKIKKDDKKKGKEKGSEKYLFRTEIKEDNGFQKRRAFVFVDDPRECIGGMYTDFRLTFDSKTYPRRFPVVDPERRKVKAFVETFYPGNNIVAVFTRNKKFVSSFDGEKYFAEDKSITVSRLENEAILAESDDKDLKKYGLTHGYFFGQGSPLKQIYLFEKDLNLSAIVDTKGGYDDFENTLFALPFCVYDRIANQEYVKTFLLSEKQAKKKSWLGSVNILKNT